VIRKTEDTPTGRGSAARRFGMIDGTEVTKDLPRLVGAKRAAEFLGVTTRTLRSWIRCGRIRAVRTAPRGGGRVLVAREEIARFYDELADAPLGDE
jgi:excisionase family DNA binding protein